MLGKYNASGYNEFARMIKTAVKDIHKDNKTGARERYFKKFSIKNSFFSIKLII